MLATAEQAHAHQAATAAAEHAIRSAEVDQPADPIPTLASKTSSLAVERLIETRTKRRPVQADWTDRPTAWRPFTTWEEAAAAWCAARRDSAKAFIASRRITTPFIQGQDTPERLRSAFVFSRSIEEAVAKAPDLPADLIAACRAEAKARGHLVAIRQRAIQTPATGFDILAKLRLITEEIDDVLDPLEPADVHEAHERPDDYPQAHEFFALHDDIVRAATEPASDQSAAESLVAELTRRWAAESQPMTEEELEEACRLTGVIAEEIMSLPSTSLDVLRAKAQAVLWCHDDKDFFDTCQAAAASTADRFMYQIIGDLLDLPATREGYAQSCAASWAERLAERNQLVDYVNTTARSLPDDVDAEAFVQPEFERGWALTQEIHGAPTSDPHARAAQIRLCLKMDEEGLDMAERSLELLREIEKTLPAAVSGAPSQAERAA